MNGEDVQLAMEIRDAMENGFEPLFLEGIIAMATKGLRVQESELIKESLKNLRRLINIAGENSRRREKAIEEELVNKLTTKKEKKSKKISISSHRYQRQRRYQMEDSINAPTQNISLAGPAAFGLHGIGPESPDASVVECVS